MTKFLFSASALALSFATSQAHASCTPSPVNSSDVVNCFGTDDSGVNQTANGLGDLDNVTVFVNDGARLTGGIIGDHTIELDDDALVVVEGGGEIFSFNDKDAVKADFGLIVYNSGKINASERAVRAGDNLELTNDGFIFSNDDGISADDNARITNLGYFLAQNQTIQAGINTNILNEGTIDSNGLGVAGGQGSIAIEQGYIENMAGANIASGLDAAISFEAGTFGESIIQNHGAIYGTSGILTDASNLSRQKLDNSGLVFGRDGVAVALGAGDDEVNLLRNSLIQGDIDMGVDDDLVTIDVAYGGIDFTGANGTSPGRLVLRDGRDVLSFYNLDLFVDDFMGGTGGVFVGGLGYDVVEFDQDFAFMSAFTTIHSVGGGIIDVSFGADTSVFSFRGFERVQLTDGLYTINDFLTVPAVPLPAGGLLLLTGLGALGLRRRRKS